MARVAPVYIQGTRSAGLDRGANPNPPTGISDELYAEVREQFNEKELSTLTFRVMGINAWNRLNVAFRTRPGSHDKAFGLDKAGLA